MILTNRRGLQASDAPAHAVLYARVSSKDQEREGFSIPAQQALLRQYAQQKQITIDAEFLDVETAKETGRPGFAALLAHFKRNRASCRTLLVEKTDRLYRNLKDYVLVDDLDVEIHFVTENVTITRNSRSSDKLLHGIRVVLAKNYIDNLSEEVRKGLRTKASQGLYPSFAPPGYVNTVGADGRRIIVPDPVLGPIVTRLFEWFASGQYSLKTLARKAYEEGFRFRKRRAQNDLERLEARLTVLYEDRLDGRISPEFFDQKAAEVREQLERPRLKLAEYRKTQLAPVPEALDMVVLTSRASELFLDQAASEQRKLLELVTQDARWQDGELRMTFREPFKQLRLSNPATQTNESPNGNPGALFEIWRRKRDSNPRASCPANGFQDRRLQPLGHSSASKCTAERHACQPSAWELDLEDQFGWKGSGRSTQSVGSNSTPQKCGAGERNSTPTRWPFSAASPKNTMRHSCSSWVKGLASMIMAPFSSGWFR